MGFGSGPVQSQKNADSGSILASQFSLRSQIRCHMRFASTQKSCTNTSVVVISGHLQVISNLSQTIV